MKKTINKLFTLILVLTLTFALAGCRKKKDGKTVISIGMWPDETETKDVAMFEEWAKRFEKDYPEYDIKAQHYSYDPTTFVSMAETGTLPTIFQTWFTEPQKLIKNEYVRDITAQLKELNWYDKMDPDMRETLSYEGKVYGVPRDGYGLGLFMNLSLFEEAGILEDLDGDGKIDIYDEDDNPLYPTTFAELTEMAKTITENLEDVAGFMVLSANKNGGWQLSNIAWNFGADLQYKNDTQKWVANLASDEMVNALEWIRDMKHEYDCLPSNVSLTYNDWLQKISQNSLAMCIVGNDAIASLYSNYSIPLSTPYAFVPMPAGPDGERYSLFGGTPYMFSSQATDEEVIGALRFLEYMGRSPEVSEVAQQSMLDGVQTAIAKNSPVLPDINPWINPEYLEFKHQIETTYCNVDMVYFRDFYNSIDTMKHAEEPYYCQEMYEALDGIIQDILGKNGMSVNIKSQLESINNSFQTKYLNKAN